MKKLKLLTGATAPLVCAVVAMALSQQAGAKEADIPRSDYPVSQSVSFLTPEQQAKAQKLIEERQKNPQKKQDVTLEQQAKAQKLLEERQKNPPQVRELTPEQQAKRDKLVNELMSQKNSTVNELTGDTRLACEAILCLASPTRPSECAKSIRRYFGITARKPHQLVTKRRNFLRLCPTSNDETVNNIINGMGNENDCSAAGVNRKFSHRSYDENNRGRVIYYNEKGLNQYCGNDWHIWLAYKCDERQVPIIECRQLGGENYCHPVMERVNGEWQAKTRTEQYNCRFVNKK